MCANISLKDTVPAIWESKSEKNPFIIELVESLAEKMKDIIYKNWTIALNSLEYEEHELDFYEAIYEKCINEEQLEHAEIVRKRAISLVIDRSLNEEIIAEKEYWNNLNKMQTPQWEFAA